MFSSDGRGPDRRRVGARVSFSIDIDDDWLAKVTV